MLLYNKLSSWCFVKCNDVEFTRTKNKSEICIARGGYFTADFTLENMIL